MPVGSTALAGSGGTAARSEVAAAAISPRREAIVGGSGARKAADACSMSVSTTAMEREGAWMDGRKIGRIKDDV